MSLSPEQVKKIADLARLQLEETERYAAELSKILHYVEKLNVLDVTGIEPTAHAVSVPTPFREDQSSSFAAQGEALAGAPDRDDQFFRVPKVI